jgi:hypothetical protein
MRQSDAAPNITVIWYPTSPLCRVLKMPLDYTRARQAAETVDNLERLLFGCFSTSGYSAYDKRNPTSKKHIKLLAGLPDLCDVTLLT